MLLRHFSPRSTGARDFALANRVLLLETSNGVALDVALAAFPFELEAIDAASDWAAAPGVVLRTCSAEHLVVYKLVAARARDLADIEASFAVKVGDSTSKRSAAGVAYLPN